MQDAENAYQDALKIYRSLAEENPAAYQALVAEALNNRGLLYSATGRMQEAEGDYKDALDTYYQLAKVNPDTYQPVVAGILGNLGDIYRATRRLKQAQDAYQESLDIYRQLANADPSAYQLQIAFMLNMLAIFELKVNKNQTQARTDAEEALKINRELWKANPEAAGDELAKSLLIDASVLAEAQQPHSALCPLAREAGVVAYDPQLKKSAADKQAEFCSAP